MAVRERIEVVLREQALGLHIDAGDVAEVIEAELAAGAEAGDEGLEVRRIDRDVDVALRLRGDEGDVREVLMDEPGDAGVLGGGGLLCAHPTVRFSSMIFCWRARKPSSSASGRGGQPGT